MGFLNETGLARFWQHIVTKLGEKLNISDAVGRKGEGDYSEIFNNYTRNVASGSYSHTEGNITIASGNSAHAEGSSTKAIGPSSHAEGMGSIAIGDISHAEGSSKTTGYASHAEGFSVAYNDYSHSEGSGSGNYALVISGEANTTTYTSYKVVEV